MNEIQLLEEDIRFLVEKEYKYELFQEKNLLIIIIKDFPFPTEFYTPEKADLFIKILVGYPMSNLDMFWTSPDVLLKNGKLPDRTISAQEERFGKKWQRWSRHYQNPWRPGIDNLRSFIQSIRTELRKGI